MSQNIVFVLNGGESSIDSQVQLIDHNGNILTPVVIDNKSNITFYDD
jgi:hypothetical protein